MFINTEQQLNVVMKELSNEKELGIDLECENNLHHYGEYISIIQISSKTKEYIVDIICIKNITSLIKLLENPKILKIFHDVNFDFSILRSQFNCRPRNIFDTEHASKIANLEGFGLATLLEKFFKVKKEKKFQMADWTKRPIKPAMLDYASGDTKYLIPLKNKLIEELKNKKRYDWYLEDMKYLETRDYISRKQKFSDLKGISTFNPNQLSVLKEFFSLREKLAKKVNRPIHFIINNSTLKNLSENLPKTQKEWSTLQRVHPIVKKWAETFYKLGVSSKKKEIFIKKESPKRLAKKEKLRFEILDTARENASEKINLAKYLIMNKDQLVSCAIDDNFESLRTWQKKLIEKEISSNV